MAKRNKTRITVTFAHNKKCFCSHCKKEILKGTPYFMFNLISTYGYGIVTKRNICYICMDKSINDYKTKEGNYGEWLKRKIARNL
jgi:hypothetical protein